LNAESTASSSVALLPSYPSSSANCAKTHS